MLLARPVQVGRPARCCDDKIHYSFSLFCWQQMTGWHNSGRIFCHAGHCKPWESGYGLNVRNKTLIALKKDWTVVSYGWGSENDGSYQVCCACTVPEICFENIQLDQTLRVIGVLILAFSISSHALLRYHDSTVPSLVSQDWSIVQMMQGPGFRVMAVQMNWSNWEHKKRQGRGSVIGHWYHLRSGLGWHDMGSPFIGVWLTTRSGIVCLLLTSCWSANEIWFEFEKSGVQILFDTRNFSATASYNRISMSCPINRGSHFTILLSLGLNSLCLCRAVAGEDYSHYGFIV